MSLDPIAFAAGDANLYRTNANAPVVNLDPTGLIEGWSIRPGLPSFQGGDVPPALMPGLPNTFYELLRLQFRLDGLMRVAKAHSALVKNRTDILKLIAKKNPKCKDRIGDALIIGKKLDDLLTRNMRSISLAMIAVQAAHESLGLNKLDEVRDYIDQVAKRIPQLNQSQQQIKQLHDLYAVIYRRILKDCDC